METGSYVRGDLAILEAGFAALEQAVLVYDVEGKIVACNPAAAKLAGRPVDDILGRGAGERGKTDHDIRPAELADACVESDRRSLESRCAVMVEERLGSGREMPLVRTIKFPLLDDEGKPYALAGLSVDVSPPERGRHD